MSETASSPSTRSVGQVSGKMRMFAACPAAAAICRASSGKAAPPESFTASTWSRRLPKAAQKAAIAASGFLRVKLEPRLKMTVVTTASGGRA